MELKITPLGPIGANCYQLREGGDLCLIDPGHEDMSFIESVKGENLTHILLTHGHYDHTGAVKILKQQHPEAEIYIHKGDANGAGSRLYPLAGEVSDLHELKDGQIILFAGKEIKVLETPGHSVGSVCFIVDNHIFTGDTLFAGSMGRTDLPGGDYEIIMKSLKKLAKLDENLQVHPGHDVSSTISRELKINPYIREALNS